MRTFFIWLFGLFGSGLVGLMVAEGIQRGDGIVGLIGGISVFACLRLWLARAA